VSLLISCAVATTLRVCVVQLCCTSIMGATLACGVVNAGLAGFWHHGMPCYIRVDYACLVGCVVVQLCCCWLITVGAVLACGAVQHRPGGVLASLHAYVGLTTAPCGLRGRLCFFMAMVPGEGWYHSDTRTLQQRHGWGLPSMQTKQTLHVNLGGGPPCPAEPHLA
jgi:hypothetical protein